MTPDTPPETRPTATRTDIVRPFIMTGGRTRSTWSDLNFETLVETLPRHLSLIHI